MAVIHMDTDEVNQMSTKIKLAVNDMMDSYESLDNRVNRLSNHWDGGDSRSFRRKADRILDRLSDQIDTLDALRMQLNREVEQWINVDRGSELSISERGGGNLYVPRRISSDSFQHLIRGHQWQKNRNLIIGENDILVSGSNSQLSRQQLYDLYLENGYADFDVNGLTYAELSALSILAVNGQLPEDWMNHPQKDFLKTKVNIYDQELASWYGDVWGDQVGTEELGYSWSVLSAEYSADAVAEFDGWTGQVGVEGSAGAYLGKISGSANHEFPPVGPVIAGVGATGVAFAGAEIAGELKGGFDPKKQEVGVKGEAGGFAGAKAEVELEGSVKIAGVELKVKPSGAVSAGAGASVNAEAGYSKGVFKFALEAGAALGLGADAGITLELDVSDLVDSIIQSTTDAAVYAAS